ncbi:LamG-like jellyroll fold domain-containing protein [Cellulomonas sp. URHD0024]|uniref:LamG-like jellyroll fold domain-containing protein n=1 Tax=Cellulomonas sp. URHD0024 TaxID=1302620 RepID=UPI0004275752|nr:LamG-like jellyroll fold domain-containing protein [Cellulomonas sp. URHD0024]
MRSAAVAIVAAAAVVIPAVSASAAGRLPNRPPVVSEAGTLDPTSSCAVGTRPAIRSTTPTLRAVLTDPENQSVSAAFAVLDSRGRVLWGPARTTAQGSGTAHSVKVPAGKLVDGGTYTWVVSGRDASHRWASPTFCQFTVDSAAPAVPGVSPVAAEPAVYVEDATSGGTGLRGSFTLSDTSTDVASYAYAFDAGPAGSVPAAAPTIAYTPTAPGPHTLSVQAVDAAGNVSPTRLYRFSVAFPVATGGGRWLLDEGSGAVGAEVAGGAPLALTPSTGWAAGPLAEVSGRPTDRALLLDSPADGAQTAGSVVNTVGSFTVIAFARLDASGSAGTVLSQDGSSTSAFTLGYTAQGCAAGITACWSFALPTADSAAAPQAVVRSAGAVEPGSWVQLTGVHDAATGSVSLFVCPIGSATKPGTLRPVASGPVAFTTPWSASGPFRVGQAFGGAAPFVGAVGSVRVIEGVAQTITDARVSCSAGA